jgi:two-component system sensor histidine kinase CiaH
MSLGSSRESSEPVPLVHERRMFNSIRWRLVALNVLVLTIILVVLELGVYSILYRSVYDRVDATLLSRAEQVIRIGQFRDPVRSAAFPFRAADAAAEGLFFLLLDDKGIVVVNPQAVPLEDLSEDREPLDQALGGKPDLRTIRLSGGQRVRIYTVALRGDGGRVAGILQVGRPLAAEEHALDLLQLLLLGGGLLGILFATVGGLFLAERALVPIRLAFRRQQDFVADASHELRTPLTLIRANAEMMTRHPEQPAAANADLLQDILSETDRLSHLVTDLLTLARADAGQEPLDLAEFSLSDLAAETVRQFAPLATAHRIDLTVAADSPLTIRGDMARMRQLLVILLDNAVKYTPEGGTVEVTCRLNRQGGRLPVTLTVSDSGSGIAAEDLPHIFERFYRADPARRHDGSAGLGLAIAQWIVAAHRGRIQAANRPSLGSSFTVQLPAA